MAVLQEYKCPCCDGAISFDSGSQKMKCPFCGTEFDVETLIGYDEDLKKDGDDTITWSSTENTWREGEEDGLRVYVCNSCGGEIVGEETTASTSCPYCGNPVVMMGQLAGILKPDYVIPFKIDKEAAKKALLQHYEGKRLLPKVFRDQNKIEEIKGIYVPFWLFDANADAHIRYKATKVRAWSDSNYNYTETRYYSVTRGGSISFEKVPVDGSKKMQDELMESIEPYSFSEAVSFQTAYLAGYFADKYDVSAEETVSRANARIKRSTEEAFRSTVLGYTSVTAVSSNINMKDGKKLYALLPVWLLNTEWNGQKFTFAINGQTGRVAGKLPMDKNAFWRWLIGLGVGIGAAVFALAWLFHRFF